MGYTQNTGYGVRSEQIVFVAIYDGIVSSGDVSIDTWTCSGHYAGFAYKGLEPYEIEHMVKIGTLRCEFQRQEGMLLNHETTVLLVTGYI